MTIYSLDLRKKAVALYEAGNMSIRKVAERLMVNKNTVNEWLKLYREQGNAQPKRVGSTRKSQLEDYKEEVKKMVAEYPDNTLAEYCEYCLEKMGVGLSESAMCRFLQKEKLTRKKKTLRASQAGTEKNQQARVDYWEEIRDVKAENLVFIDEMAILLGIMREYGRSLRGTRIYDKKPFYRGERMTVIRAISQEKVIAFDIIGKSLKAFIRRFVPKSKIVVEALLRMAVKYLVSSVHLRNYFAHCCYCTS